jgi:hypothetical protein
MELEPAGKQRPTRRCAFQQLGKALHPAGEETLDQVLHLPGRQTLQADSQPLQVGCRPDRTIVPPSVIGQGATLSGRPQPRRLSSHPADRLALTDKTPTALPVKGGSLPAQWLIGYVPWAIAAIGDSARVGLLVRPVLAVPREQLDPLGIAEPAAEGSEFRGLPVALPARYARREEDQHRGGPPGRVRSRADNAGTCGKVWPLRPARRQDGDVRAGKRRLSADGRSVLLAELLLRHPELAAEAAEITSRLLVVEDQRELGDEITPSLRALRANGPVSVDAGSGRVLDVFPSPG